MISPGEHDGIDKSDLCKVSKTLTKVDIGLLVE